MEACTGTTRENNSFHEFLKSMAKSDIVILAEFTNKEPI
jgi:hypothetical protein